jgi:DNA-binding PadR family transcriptional regulator
MNLPTSVTPVILGLLELRPQSGYEIKQFVDDSTRFFWAASYGQIYPELKRLEREGLIEGEDAPAGGRKRTVYRLTPAGRDVLLDWLRTPGTAYELRDEGLLKLFFAGALPREDALAIVREMRERHARTLERLREVEPRAKQLGGYPYVVLECGLHFHETMNRWYGETEERLLAEPVRKES